MANTSGSTQLDVFPPSTPLRRTKTLCFISDQRLYSLEQVPSAHLHRPSSEPYPHPRIQRSYSTYRHNATIGSQSRQSRYCRQTERIEVSSLGARSLIYPGRIHRLREKLRRSVGGEILLAAGSFQVFAPKRSQLMRWSNGVLVRRSVQAEDLCMLQIAVEEEDSRNKYQELHCHQGSDCLIPFFPLLSHNTDPHDGEKRPTLRSRGNPTPCRASHLSSADRRQ